MTRDGIFEEALKLKPHIPDGEHGRILKPRRGFNFLRI